MFAARGCVGTQRDGVNRAPTGLLSLLSWSTEFVAGHFQRLTGKFK